MVFDDRTAYRQPQTHAVGLRRESCVKNALEHFWFDARAGYKDDGNGQKSSWDREQDRKNPKDAATAPSDALSDPSAGGGPVVFIEAKSQIVS
jgi:hypothetical protein